MDDTLPAVSSTGRSLLAMSAGLLAVGFTSTALALWSLFGTVDAGGGANIGGGILALFGTAVGCVGLVLLAVTAALTIASRRRRHAGVSGRGAPGRGTT